LFALGGGELINRDRLFISGSWAPKLSIPKIILGCGVNADKYSQLSNNTLCELYSYKFIGLRDFQSATLLSSDCQLRNQIGLFYDLAFSLDTSKIVPKTSDERVAVVIPTDRFSNKSDRGIKQYGLAHKSLKWLKPRVAPFDRVVFLAFGEEDNNDYNTCLSLSKSLGKESTIIGDCVKNKDLMLQTIASATSVFTYRLHGLILAKLFNRPYGFYPYHSKLCRVEETLHGCPTSLIRNWQRAYLDQVLTKIGFS
jgi:polysaccharide pyruvyl transferase WcaK-like protein